MVYQINNFNLDLVVFNNHLCIINFLINLACLTSLDFKIQWAFLTSLVASRILIFINNLTNLDSSEVDNLEAIKWWEITSCLIINNPWWIIINSLVVLNNHNKMHLSSEQIIINKILMQMHQILVVSHFLVFKINRKLTNI